MNIAMFAWEALEGIAVGGGAQYASRLAAALVRAGHRVRLFTRIGPNQPMDEIVDGVQIRRCPWDRKPGFIDEIAALADSFAYYFDEAVGIDGPYDVVHCHEWFTIQAGLQALHKHRFRLAVGFHSTEWGRTGVWPDAGDSARIAGIERAGIEQAESIIAASYWCRRLLEDQFHPPDWKCEVVYHGADPFANRAETMPSLVERCRRKAGIPSGAPMVLFAGRFSKQGGGDLAARACRLASEKFPAAKFVFIGAGPMLEQMKAAAGPAALFLPPRGRLVPPEWYYAADMVLAPFRRDTNGRAVMPAWEAAKPVAVLANTVPAEFVLPNANGWVAHDDADELAAAIIQALANPETAAWMGANGRTALETAFTWDESARRLLHAYKRRDRMAAAKPNPSSRRFVR